MDFRTVAAVLEETSRIARRHRLQSSAHRLYKRFAGTCPSPPQKQRLELRKRFFYGVEIGGVGRQVHHSSQPLSSMSSHTPTALCEERLSITTTCPGRSDGASTRSR